MAKKRPNTRENTAHFERITTRLEFGSKTTQQTQGREQHCVHKKTTLNYLRIVASLVGAGFYGLLFRFFEKHAITIRGEIVSKMIDFATGVMPSGFSEPLSKCFNLVSIDIYATQNLTDGTLPLFFSEGDYYLVKANGKQHVTYRELGRYEVLEGIFSKGDYLNSFFVAENIFLNKNNQQVKLIVLLYDERGQIHIWNPSFEELFLPLIFDDLDHGC